MFGVGRQNLEEEVWVTARDVGAVETATVKLLEGKSRSSALRSL